MWSVVNFLRGLVFIYFLFFTLLVGMTLHAPIALLLLITSYKSYRSWLDYGEKSYCMFACWIIENVMGMKTYYSGDEVGLEKAERALIISNHRTRLDWMLVWPLLMRYGRLEHLKIVTKAVLKQLWSTQFSDFVFLERNWESDQAAITEVLQNLGRQKFPGQILLFPEGTDKTAFTTQRSESWEKKQGLPHLEHLLQPRRQGFIHFVKESRANYPPTHVWDITLGYHPFIPQSERYILKGFPSTCHIHVRRTKFKDLPKDDDELGEWLQEQWQEKDKLLDYFYKHHCFPSNPDFPTSTTHKNPAKEAEVQRQMQLYTGFWSIFVSLGTLALWYYPAFRWFVLLSMTIFVVGTNTFGWNNVVYALQPNDERVLQVYY